MNLSIERKLSILYGINLEAAQALTEAGVISPVMVDKLSKTKLNGLLPKAQADKILFKREQREQHKAAIVAAKKDK